MSHPWLFVMTHSCFQQKKWSPNNNSCTGTKTEIIIFTIRVIHVLVRLKFFNDFLLHQQVQRFAVSPPSSLPVIYLFLCGFHGFSLILHQVSVLSCIVRVFDYPAVPVRLQLLLSEWLMLRWCRLTFLDDTSSGFKPVTVRGRIFYMLCL